MSKFQDDLKEQFQDEEYRYAYAEDFLNTWVATQVVTLREQRGLSQAELGRRIGTKQPGVSRLENVNHSAWNTETLKKIARALGVRLHISFETFGSLLEEDGRFSRERLMRPEFKNDTGVQGQPPQAKQGFLEWLRHASEVSAPLLAQPSEASSTSNVLQFPAGRGDSNKRAEKETSSETAKGPYSLAR